MTLSGPGICELTRLLSVRQACPTAHCFWLQQLLRDEAIYGGRVAVRIMLRTQECIDSFCEFGCADSVALLREPPLCNLRLASPLLAEYFESRQSRNADDARCGSDVQKLWTAIPRACFAEVLMQLTG